MFRKGLRSVVEAYPLVEVVGGSGQWQMRDGGASAYLTKESAIEQLYNAMTNALALCQPNRR